MKRLAAVIILSLILGTPVQAQFFKKLKKKATDAVERTVSNRAEREVEKSTERALDSVVDAPKKKKKSNKSSKDTDFNPMSMMGGPVDYNSSYTFPLNITMEVDDFDGKNSKKRMLQYYGKESFGMKDPESGQLTVMDFENQSALMLNPNDRTGQAVSLKFLDKMMKDIDLDAAAGDTENVSFKKTGESKTIAGYLSHEYEVITDEGKMNIWFAPKVPFSSVEYMQGFSKLFGKQFQGNWDDSFWETYGFMMQGDVFDKRGKLESRMVVTKVDTKSYAINTKDYQIQKF